MRFHAQMKKVSDKFDALDTKLDDLESKRSQLRQVLVPWLLSLGFAADPLLDALCAVLMTLNRFSVHAQDPGKRADDCPRAPESGDWRCA